MEFQIYDYLEDHELDDYSDFSDEESETDIPNYIIHTFGRTLDGKSVYAKIVGFKPFFFIELPTSWTKRQCKDNMSKMKTYLLSKYNRKIYKYKNGLIDVNVVTKKSAEGFTNDELRNFGVLFFNNSYAMKKYMKLFDENKLDIYSISREPIRYKTFEGNLPPMLRCFHMRNISGCAWIRTEKYKTITEKYEKVSHCDIEITVNYKNISPVEKEVNAPLRIASFDIECYSCDDQFPQAKRKSDKIIQIGTTYTYLGESIPYRQHIVCLGETSDVEGAIVESYETEKELVEGWLNEITKADCDILTGYNIFYFDEKYIYDRCVEHLYDDKNDMKINYISKLKNRNCRFKEMKLASSALGENLLRYWDSPGRVHIDLMKDVQKTYNLTSYKLDSVAANFIRGQVNRFEKIKKNKYKLYCSSINDIFKEDFIHLELVRSFVSDDIGKKYIVEELDEKEKTLVITSKTDINLKKEVDFSKGKLFWSQAKDDVGPKDIFRLFKGTPDDRGVVAKYCVKDCRLVNLLVNKLEVVTKNIEMANVCYVPFPYLFTRGQGIKLFSLCLKEFRNHGYVFPVVKKKVEFYYPVIKNREETLHTDKTKLYKGTIIRSPYSRDDEGDLGDRDSYIYKYLMEVDTVEGKKYKPKRHESNIIEYHRRDIDIQKKDGYEGAIVFDPIPEVQYEALATKDFASLYPSSIIQKNMSHETIVLSNEYDNLEGIEYYNACFRENDGHIEWRRFAKKDNKLGVVPTILSTLLKERKAVKKKMKVEKDQFKYKILDAKQLALKITANSLYGQLGASTSPVCMRDIAACTTSTGREMLIFAKKYDEEILPWIINGLKQAYLQDKPKIVEKILKYELNNHDEKFIQKIKQFCYTQLKDITMQPIIRYGDTDSIFSTYTFREGCKELNKKKSLELFKSIIQFGKELIIPFIPIEFRFMWEELFDKYYIISEIEKLTLPNDYKVEPYPEHHKTILPIEVRMKQFLKEYMEESYFPWLWTLQDIMNRNFKEKDYNDVLRVKLFNFGNSLIEKMRISPEVINDDEKKILIEKIKSFVSKTLKEYVLQNYWWYKKDNKQLKVKFYKKGNKIIDKNSLVLTMDIGIISGELVKSRLPFPHDLEYEKTFWPFLILTKKRYVGNKYEFDLDKFKRDSMGIVLKRRDNAPIVKEVCGGIISKLIEDRDPIGAKNFTKKCLDDIFEDKYDVKYFLTSKTLKTKESYKDWKRIAHVVLSERIGVRDPGNKPQSGDRITYAAIKIENETKSTLQGDKIETPDYIKEKKLELDYLFYLNNQIMKPALQFLNLAVNDANEIFNERILIEENKKLGRTDIKQFLIKKD